MRMIRCAAASLVLLAACTQAKAPDTARALLWKVSDADNSIYLLGSFHALREDDYPLPRQVEDALADAEAMAFEVSPAEMESPELATTMLKAATLGGGKTLKDVLPAATWSRLQDYCRRNGIGIKDGDTSAPWFVALKLTLDQMARQGFKPALGLDRHMMEQARWRSRPTQGLETAADQIRVLAGMPLALQAQSLDEVLDDSQGGASSLEALHASWRRGDARALEKEMVDELAGKYAELYRRINVDRNQAWLPQLRAMLDRGGSDDTLVVVGALHLLGKDGLVQQLQAKGYRVERM